ncbi:hypothetical protein TRVL_07339 [Trypanosoma vivax]|nr:hypothetical protein TRVL_07339 [Trypanosoma vivax]
MGDVGAVVAAIITIATGLFVIDLVPLQENMVCLGNYSNASTCPDVFFSQTFQGAREKFVNAAQKAKAELQRHVIVQWEGVDYTMDTAFIRGKNAKRLLIHLSGSDGVGGFSSSAIQTKLLSEWNASRADGPSVLFLHAVNPYGMAFYQIGNENNVELHRNYLSPEDWKAVHLEQSRNTDIEDALKLLYLPQAPRVIDRYLLFFRFAKVFFTHGWSIFWKMVEKGQRRDAVGVFYGGQEEQRSISVLREVPRQYTTGGVEAFVFIDVRTGSGTVGRETIFTSTAQDETLAKSIFTSTVVLRPNGGANASSMGRIRPVDILSTGNHSLLVEEVFSTTNLPFMIRSALLSNGALRHAKGSYVHMMMQQWMRDAHAPQTINYKKDVLRRGEETFNAAWNHLLR